MYSKLVTNDGAANAAIARLRKNHPAQGLVQVLKVTEKQYATMVFITGKRPEFEEIETMEEFVVL